MGEENAYCGVCLGDTGKEIPLQWCHCTIFGGVNPDIVPEEEFECWKQDFIVCPWCGYEDDSPWEYDHDSGEIECNDCGKAFHYEREVEVSYTTTKQKVEL